MKIRIAVAATNTPADADALVDLVEGLEKRRFDTLWLSDTPMTAGVEPLTALAVASGYTERLKLGTNVVIPGRNPLLLAKQLAHLDRLTGGRLLLAFMPGIGSSRERAALGATGLDRNRLLAETIELCRAWWSGEELTGEYLDYRFEGIRVGPSPVQQPLEIWLGGNGPKGLELTGTHGDGWLGSRATPEQAGANRATIEQIAAASGRHIDDDHFGISIPYSRVALDDSVVAAVMRNCDAERREIVPIDPAELTELLHRHIAAGISKFVLRPMALPDGWDAELDFLFEHALPFQN